MSFPRKLTLPRPMRLLLFPFPWAVALGSALLVIVDHVIRPDRSRIEDGGLAGTPGTCVIAVIALLLQLVWGVPTLLWLENVRCRVGGYAVVGIVSGVGLSLGLALILQAPQFGETFWRIIPFVLLFIGAPLVLSYLFAYSLQPDKRRTAGRSAATQKEGLQSME